MGRHAGYTNRRRKAIVKLTADSKEIEIFQAFNILLRRRREIEMAIKKYKPTTNGRRNMTTI